MQEVCHGPEKTNMTSSILRTMLSIAILLGVGVIVNIFGNGEQAGNQPGKIVGRWQRLDQAPAAGVQKLSRQDNERRVLSAVRRELEAHGYLNPSKRSDHLGVQTTAAILAFEFDHNLSLSAQPSERLLKTLLFAPAKKSTTHLVPETDEARQLIKEVQRALANLGYGPSKVTEELDRATQHAIRKFERARGLQASGRVSAPLIESLGPAFDRTRIGRAERAQAPNAG